MPLDRAQSEIMALQLAALAVDIEAIGAALCADPSVIAAHGVVLQSVDLIAQRQRALARLLQAENVEEALGDCNLDQVVELFAAT